MARLKVYIAGKLGEPPTVVTTSLVRAMTEVVTDYVGGNRDAEGYPEQWTCSFIDGVPGADMVQWTLTVEDHGSHALYIRVYEIDDDETP